jgi:AhpC/TSA family protein
MRILKKGVAIFAVLYVVALGALYRVMREPVLFGQVMRRVPGPAMFVLPFKPLWFLARAGNLSVGDRAPDFSLPTADKNARVRLSDYRGQRPVVLVFGSYT